MAITYNHAKLSKIFDLAFRAKKNYEHSMFCENVWHGMYQGICALSESFDEQDELLESHADSYEKAASLHTDLMWNALFELFEELESLEKKA